MELVRGIHSLSRTLAHPVVTIGNFDGVHLGHQRIIAETVAQAKARAGTGVAFTFRPHPQVALRPEARLQLLCTYDEKTELLGGLGLDVVVEEPFSREFSTTAPEQFFTDVLLHGLNAEAVVVGYDFAFGKERQGHLDTLEAFCKKAGVGLTVVQPQRIGGEIASSSRIRQHLVSGEIEAASRLLGRPFFYRGTVIRGEGRGRQIGFPTANLRLENKLVLPYGVYATWASVDGRRYPSVTNVGVRPTFRDSLGNELPAMIETHLIGETIDLYGRTLEVRFVHRMRDEKKFGGVEELKAQIALDVAAASGFLK